VSGGPGWSWRVLASVKMVLAGLGESWLVSRGPGWSGGVLASVKMVLAGLDCHTVHEI